MRDDEAIPAASIRDVSGILLDRIYRTFVPLWNILQHVRVVREENCRGHKLSLAWGLQGKACEAADCPAMVKARESVLRVLHFAPFR